MEQTIFKGNPTLESDRLILRKLALSDADDIFAYASDPEVTKYMLWDTHTAVDDSRRFISTKLKQYEKDETGEWGITLKENGKLVGAMGIASVDMDHEKAEIGYVLARPYWGKGIVPEAVERLLKFAYEEMGLNRIECWHFLPNENSGRVMQKVGMTFEGIARERYFVKGRYWDAGQYAILRKDWLKLHYSDTPPSGTLPSDTPPSGTAHME
jgi:ribosomal-protein-alanine N-acetyltransferase